MEGRLTDIAAAGFWLEPLSEAEVREFVSRHAPLCGRRAGRRTCTRRSGHGGGDAWHYDLGALTSFSGRAEDPPPNRLLSRPATRVDVSDLVGPPPQGKG